MARFKLPSSWLVALQFGLIGALLLTSWPPSEDAPLPAALAMLLAAAVIGVAALMANKPGNFNIQPELKSNARLVTSGIYRCIRHPMYSAVLLAMLAAMLADPRGWRVAVWLGLLAVLSAKAQREEGYLQQRFAQYGQYRARTWRLLPWLW